MVAENSQTQYVTDEQVCAPIKLNLEKQGMRLISPTGHSFFTPGLSF